MLVSEAVGRTLVACGIDHVFGVVGSGNFHVTTAMVAAGARYVATRHEGGGATSADGYARISGRPTAVSVHQGCGFTNAMTGIAEAAKSRTPLVVVAAEVTERRSNFFVDQEAMARAVGAVPHRVTSAEEAVAQTVAAVAQAVHGRRTVVLNLPLPVQGQEVPDGALDGVGLPAAPDPVEPSADDVRRLAAALATAQRPVFVAGRGSRSAGAREALRALADRVGALLATSAVAKGLFSDDPWQIDVSGGFSSPLAAELVGDADLIVGWGCALNMWTMRHGRLIAGGATVVQVDDTPDAIGAHRDLTFGVVGDVARTAEAVAGALGEGTRTAYRTPEVGARLGTELRWRDVPFDDGSGDGRVDPRALSIAIDDLLPAERVVAVDSGNFMGYPSMFLSVPDEEGFCFTQAFQSIGLGLATAIGAALARPDRLPVAALGDGGALMGAAELETVVRLGLPMLVVVYDDEAYGAEVHHFGPDGHDLGTVQFPPTGIAAIGRGYGMEAVTVTSVEDLAPVAEWVAGGPTGPMLLHAKVTRDEASWWLEEAFKGH
ncbi:thiamine pyrophosphate-binding protein [Ornithinimicrobium cerasi]|uniref:Acetolactate synthase large subunit n=1 Tax=Ornithinimicrobium cerasi TaxID=2248773 RepID=A0A285VHU3_9MICO|nr:thiamine pyrophosphate-binding protein [Ornithinimicrobium cerasi]SOC53684.1 Acetolactate synthase large subunit [Ornithinimicrobium cerasi]